MPLINYQVICSNPLTQETEFKFGVGKTNTTCHRLATNATLHCVQVEVIGLHKQDQCPLLLLYVTRTRCVGA